MILINQPNDKLYQKITYKLILFTAWTVTGTFSALLKLLPKKDERMITCSIKQNIYLLNQNIYLLC